MTEVTQDWQRLLHHVAHPYLEVVPAVDFQFALLGARKNSCISVFATETEKLWVLGLGPEIGQLAQEISLDQPARWTVPRSAEDLLHPDRSQWDWWAIDRDPTWPLTSPPVIDLKRDHDERIRAFLALASPTASTSPGSAEVMTWHGVEEEGQLLAVGAAIRWKSGAPVLASIATHPDSRGKGLAKSITASLTQYFREQGEERITLGMYAANEQARQTYLAVGYRVVQEFSSGTSIYSSGTASTPASDR
jgi:ribosomal protein S18 acetylase RimI-like enzyme